MGSRYTIILEEDVEVDPRVYGDLVAAALGLTRIEARIAVRKGRGIFLEHVEEDHARRIADRLGEDSIAARLVAEEEMPTLPPLRKATHLDHGEDILTCRIAGTDKREHVPWEAILATSVGVVARPAYVEIFGHVRFDMVPPMHEMEGTDREMVRENLLLKMAAGQKGDARRKPDSIFEDIDERYGTKVHVYADLLTSDLRTWLRVPMDEIGYLYMTNSIRMGGAMGMQLLMVDLREKCASTLSPMTLKLLDATDIKTLVFPQIEEFNRYTAWHVLKRIPWTNADLSSPSLEVPEPSTDGDSSSSSPEPEPPSTSS